MKYDKVWKDTKDERWEEEKNFLQEGSILFPGNSFLIPSVVLI